MMEDSLQQLARDTRRYLDHLTALGVEQVLLAPGTRAAASTSPGRPRPTAPGPATTKPGGTRPKPASLVHEKTKPDVAAIPGDAAGKLALLKSLALYYDGCTDCKLCRMGRTQVVYGVGDPDARLMFIGEGPGADEDRLGEPFVGKAGQLLTRIITAMGLSRETVYIANVVKCRPPGNRDPEADEMDACFPKLREQIAIVQPEVIVSLGRIAIGALCGDVGPITRARGVWRDFDGIPLMTTLHPSYLLRNPAAKHEVWRDMQDVMQRLGLPLPESKT